AARTQSGADPHPALSRNGRGDTTAVEDAEEAFGACLETAWLPEVDLLIRTSGEQRLSNFLPWHAAYAELYFTPVLWPDFDDAHLQTALAAFRSRVRRYGCAPASSANMYTEPRA